MGLFSTLFSLMLSVISLDPVVGRGLTARADFDAYNVYVGDPVVLTVDFIGEADFAALHPPVLSTQVDSAVWKVDDKSAKTGTYRNARRLSYRVRPLKEGLHEFPSLTFSYKCADSGKTLQISTSPVPLRAKKGAQAVLSDVEGADRALPLPDGLFVDLSKSPWGSDKGLSEDALFAWERACMSGKAESFSSFDFPEARLNEAACEILAGNWARAMSLYASIEWRIGQTETVERGIVAAIVLKTSNPEAELPMWRQFMRPLLKYTWKGRAVALLSAVLVLMLASLLLRRLMKAIVCFAAIVLLCQSVQAIDPFEEMERMQEELSKRMQNMASSMGGLGGANMVVNGTAISRPDITLSVSADKSVMRVGEVFNIIISMDAPKDCTLSGIRLDASVKMALSMAGDAENLPNESGSSTNRIVRKMSIPLRYDAPFKGGVVFTVSGMCERSVRRGSFSSMFSTSFSCVAPPVNIEVKPLEGVDVPEDFNGCVGEEFFFEQHASTTKVETNDVVAITAVVRSNKGYVPENAFDSLLARNREMVAFRKFFIADGSANTSDLSFSYYDTTKKKFCKATAKGVPLKYIHQEVVQPRSVVVDDVPSQKKKLALKFAPRSNSRDVAQVMYSQASDLRISEEYGQWVRVDDGHHAGWILKDELK